MTKVFVIGRHPQLMDTVLNFLKQKGYYAKGETENNAAIAAFSAENFDVVVIGGGVDAAARSLFKNEFIAQNSDIVFVEHYGAPDALPMEIEEALNKNPL